MLRRPVAAPLACLVLLACARAPLPPAPPPVAPPPTATATDAGAVTPFDPAPWLEDLRALTLALSSHYANLDEAIDERKMDLPALRAKTEARLRRATSDADAKRALESFVDAFGDAHFSIRWTPSKADVSPRGGPLCARLGYDEVAGPGVDFRLTGRWTAIDDADANDFPGGLLHLSGGATLGTIRIGLFMAQLHPALCEAARAELGLADDAACDDACQNKLSMNVADRMTAALERRAVSLARAGATALVVDITGNGGGSNWVDPAARVLTPVPLRAPRMGFVRHPHWVEQFQDEQKDLAIDRAAKDTPLLASAAATLHAAEADARTPCDRSAVWEAGAPRPACSQLVTNRIFTSGVLPYAKPGSFEGLHASDSLFSPAQFAFHEGVVSLPLIVLVDGGTASASEQFAAMLADNHAALIVGSLTTGCGCGFTNGGIPTTLPRSGAAVHIPDCARLRADGTNEASGVVPDVLLPLAWRDSPYQRAEKIEAGLAVAVTRLRTPKGHR